MFNKLTKKIKYIMILLKNIDKYLRLLNFINNYYIFLFQTSKINEENIIGLSWVKDPKDPKKQHQNLFEFKVNIKGIDKLININEQNKLLQEIKTSYEDYDNDDED